MAGEGGTTVTGQVQAKPDVQHPPGQSPATKNDCIQNVSSAKARDPDLKGSADYKTQAGSVLSDKLQASLQRKPSVTLVQHSLWLLDEPLIRV